MQIAFTNQSGTIHKQYSKAKTTMSGREFSFILQHSGLSYTEFAQRNNISTETLYRERTSKIVKAVYVSDLEKICKPKQFEELRKEFKKLLEEEDTEDEK